MSRHEDQFDPRVDAALDRQLSAEQRASAESELGPHLTRAREEQSRIDEALGRLYAPPAVGPVMARIEDTIAATAGSGAGGSAGAAPSFFSLWGKHLLAASLFIVAGVMAYVNLVPPKPQDPYATEGVPRRTLGELFASAVGSGFKPDWKCETDQEFQNTFLGQLGQAISVRPLISPDEWTGISYLPSLSSKTTVVLARVGGEPVMVFVDQKSCDRMMAKADPPLHVHKRHLGELVLYEVSRSERPLVLDHFYVPGS